MDSVDKSGGAVDFVGDGELTANAASTSRGSVDNVGDGNGKLESNGSCSNAVHGSGTSGNFDDIAFRDGGIVEEGFGSKQVGGSSTSSPRLSLSPAAGTSPTMKGYGLKKWRRIKRDVVKDGSGGMDSGKAMKRGLSGSGNPVRPVNFASSMGDKQSSEVFIGSIDGNGVPGSSSDSRFAVGSAFTAGADSENSVSEDRSSKSSTAASAPRARNDIGGGSGYGRENNRIKPLPAKIAGSSVQCGQQGKGHVESSKKARGERAKKENSHSSMESDSRSSNFVFTQGLYSVTSNGKQSETSMNDDGENSDEAHAGERHGSEEIHTTYDHETVEELGYQSHDGSAVDASSQNKDEKNENKHPSKEKDPLVESMFMLQSVQEALESEIQKLGEIGKISSNPADPPHTDPEVSSSSFARFEAETMAMLSENVKHLESRLKEALTMLCAKEARVAELEDALQRGRSESQQANTDDTEIEFMFKQKLEAEFQCLALTKALQHSTPGEVEALIGEQEQMVQKLREVDSKAEELKRGAEELKYHGEVLGAEKEVSEIRQGLRKAASCFSIQLMLLILVVWLVVLQLSPHSGVVVPT